MEQDYDSAPKEFLTQIVFKVYNFNHVVDRYSNFLHWLLSLEHTTKKYSSHTPLGIKVDLIGVHRIKVIAIRYTYHKFKIRLTFTQNRNLGELP